MNEIALNHLGLWGNVKYEETGPPGTLRYIWLAPFTVQ